MIEASEALFLSGQLNRTNMGGSIYCYSYCIFLSLIFRPVTFFENHCDAFTRNRTFLRKSITMFFTKRNNPRISLIINKLKIHPFKALHVFISKQIEGAIHWVKNKKEGDETPKLKIIK